MHILQSFSQYLLDGEQCVERSSVRRCQLFGETQVTFTAWCHR